jgi:hypothetical protein
MAFDARPVRDHHDADPRLVRRAKLLALAGALDDLGLRARIVEYTLRPTVVRYWDPRHMTVTRQVTCEPLPGTARWQFRHHPSGNLLTDATHVTDPADAKEAALILAAALTVRRG